MTPGPEAAGLRVAFVAGSLRLGGAEKQLWYQARSLTGLGARVRVFSLTRGEHYEGLLDGIGAETRWIGRSSWPPVRLLELISGLRGFQPHIVQATHAFANLYAAVAARAVGAVSLGALRGSLRRCVEANGSWTKWLMSLPTALVTNSRRSCDEVAASGLVEPERLHVLENAIDLSEFEPSTTLAARDGGLRVFLVGTLSRVKRADVFLEALAQARDRRPGVRGVVVGSGPELGDLKGLALRLGLGPDGVEFLGQRKDVPALLAGAGALVMCSDDEGTPNAVMEAMAAGVPVVATPAGDAPLLIQDGVSGWIVAFGDAGAIADRLVRLHDDSRMRFEVGEAARERMGRSYGTESLARRLFSLYRSVAEREDRLECLEALGGAAP